MLDAGQHFNRSESACTGYVAPRELRHAVDIRRNAESRMTRSDDHGMLRTWEPIKGDNGYLGCAVVMVDPASVAEAPDTTSAYLVVARVPDGRPAVYYAGSAWNKAGVITSVAAWDHSIDNVARRVRTPLEVAIEPAR